MISSNLYNHATKITIYPWKPTKKKHHFPICLVIKQPSWNIWVRQLGWFFHSQSIVSHKSHYWNHQTSYSRSKSIQFLINHDESQMLIVTIHRFPHFSITQQTQGGPPTRPPTWHDGSAPPGWGGAWTETLRGSYARGVGISPWKIVILTMKNRELMVIWTMKHRELWVIYGDFNDENKELMVIWTMNILNILEFHH